MDQPEIKTLPGAVELNTPKGFDSNVIRNVARSKGWSTEKQQASTLIIHNQYQQNTRTKWQPASLARGTERLGTPSNPLSITILWKCSNHAHTERERKFRPGFAYVVHTISYAWQWVTFNARKARRVAEQERLAKLQQLAV